MTIPSPHMHSSKLDFVHRRVVTSFICKLENSSFKDFKVSIFKRSDRVRTHQLLWSACSGTIDGTDPDPLAAAWRELEEETGLNSDDLSLLQEGKPHDVFSEDLRCRWTVHPFAFVLKPESEKEIILNWENTEIRFVDPEQVETYNTVPDLDITLWRTLVGPDTAKGLRALSEDKDSGARTLATKAVRVLLMAVTGGDFDWSSNVTSYWRGFRLVAWHLANGRPSMGAAIERAVLRVIVVATPMIAKANTVDDAKQAIIQACMETLDERSSGRGNVAQEFVRYLQSPTHFSQDPNDEVTFLTLSRSCAKLCILEYIKQSPSRRVHVIILESRPCFEGIHMAVDVDKQVQEFFAKQPPEERNRVRVTLAADAAVGTLAHSVDFVLLGGDRINHAGDVSNKVGSLIAVLTARELSHKRNARILCTAETEKISRRRDTKLHVSEKHACSDLTWAWQVSEDAKEALKSSPLVEIATPLFEWVPSRYVDTYITEKGPLNHQMVDQLSEAAAREWDDVFRDL